MAVTPSQIVKGIVKVASLPEIFIKVDEALSKPGTSNNQLAAIIEEDPALSAKLLRISNSSFYNFVSEISSITHAITIIGTQQLRDLVLACSVLRTFRDIPDDVISMENFWRHSVACGVTARIIAAKRFVDNVEQFFVGGLLHDIGKLIMLMYLPKDTAHLYASLKQQEMLLHQAEKEHFGFNHAKLGGALLLEWKIPVGLREMVSYHHAPQDAHRFPQNAAIIHVADMIVNALQLGFAGEKYVPPLNPKAWQQCGLQPDDINSIVQQLSEQYEEAVKFILDP